MPKASITLPDGTIITIDGTAEEVRGLLGSYSSGATARRGRPDRPKAKRRGPTTKLPAHTTIQDPPVDLTDLVNWIKTCSEAETIEERVLDQKNQLSRVLLALYAVHEHKKNSIGLTSGQISKITSDLGIRVSQPNASKCLSGQARSYVEGDKVRVKGQPVRYKLNRRGAKHMKEVLSVKNNG